MPTFTDCCRIFTLIAVVVRAVATCFECEACQILPAVCPHGWLAWKDSCYVLLPEKRNFLKASRACDQLGSNLVVPGSREEQDFIWQQMKVQMGSLGAISDSDYQVWIGCKTSDRKQLMCLGEKSETAFENWAANEPNKDNVNCIRMAEKFSGKWGDTVCDTAYFAACEMRISRRVYCLPADANGRFITRCLLNHEIKNLTDGVIECGGACVAEPLCHSFNLLQQAGKSRICQLNNATRLEADNTTDFKEVEGCLFFEL